MICLSYLPGEDDTHSHCSQKGPRCHFLIAALFLLHWDSKGGGLNSKPSLLGRSIFLFLPVPFLLRDPSNYCCDEENKDTIMEVMEVIIMTVYRQRVTH